MMLVEDLPISAHQVAFGDYPRMKAVGLVEHQLPVAQDAVVVVIAPFSLCDLVPGGHGSDRFGEVGLRFSSDTGKSNFLGHGFSFGEWNLASGPPLADGE